MKAEDAAVNAGNGVGYEGPLAEFAAIRAAIESCIERMTKLHLFQLSTAGAIFAFVMSGKGRTGLLLIVPVSSYLLHSAWLNNYETVMHMGRFVNEELTRRVPGGLHWESWRRLHPIPERLPGGYHHLLLSFAGVTLLALAWAAKEVFTGWSSSPWLHLGLLVAWIVGLGSLVAQVYLSRGRW